MTNHQTDAIDYFFESLARRECEREGLKYLAHRLVKGSLVVTAEAKEIRQVTIKGTITV